MYLRSVHTPQSARGLPRVLRVFDARKSYFYLPMGAPPEVQEPWVHLSAQSQTSANGTVAFRNGNLNVVTEVAVPSTWLQGGGMRHGAEGQLKQLRLCIRSVRHSSGGADTYACACRGFVSNVCSQLCLLRWCDGAKSHCQGAAVHATQSIP